MIRSSGLGVNAFVVKLVSHRECFEAVCDLGVFWAVMNEPPPIDRKLGRGPVCSAPIPPERLPTARALCGEVATDHEHALTTLDGRRVVVLVDAVPVYDGQCRAKGALAALQASTPDVRRERIRALNRGYSALPAPPRIYGPDWPRCGPTPSGLLQAAKASSADAATKAITRRMRKFQAR